MRIDLVKLRNRITKQDCGYIGHDLQDVRKRAHVTGVVDETERICRGHFLLVFKDILGEALPKLLHL